MADIKPKLIGIAGGSGSGKSTLAVALCRAYPELFALLHVDDYFKKKEDVPKIGERANWDHPDALRFADLHHDLSDLQAGRSAHIYTKSELYNPSYTHEKRDKIDFEVLPKPFVLLEGYLALHDPRIRELLDLKIFLDIPISVSIRRRSANKFAFDADYFETILAPMHAQFVEPTKNYADHVIDVSGRNPEEVQEAVEKLLFVPLR